MANFVSMGSDFDTHYARYTQFILEYALDQTAIMDPDNNNFLSYNILHPKNLSNKYNKYRVSSFVISTDITSFNETVTDFLDQLLRIMTCVLEYGNGKDQMKEIRYVHHVDFLGIIERHNTKGWHLHLLCFYRDNFTNDKEFIAEQVLIFSRINTLFKLAGDGNQYFINCETVKSVGSMINYLKKDPYYIIATTTELAQMYVHFERTHIFPENSKPKFTHSKTHSLPNSTIVDFFSKKLEAGCIDYEEALQDDYAVNFLANRNLKEIFENARTHYLANRKFKNAITEIITKFLTEPWYKKCICPIKEYLKIQQINLDIFEDCFVRWLKCNSKKNTLALIGPADTGKSVFLSTLHNNFRFANRLTTDGIFTFANTINADVVYHEEPFITPETCEVAKLVYEGNPHVTVAVKNRSAIRLNKKIPVLITSNDNIYKYCSGQKLAFDARMLIFKPTFRLSNMLFCNDTPNITHICSPLNVDTKRRAYKSLHGDAGEQNQWERDRSSNIDQEDFISNPEIVDSPVSCGLIHKLHKNHWRAYIFYIITKYELHEYFDCLYKNVEPFEIPTISTSNNIKLPYNHNYLPDHTDYLTLLKGTNYKNICYLNNFHCINL